MHSDETKILQRIESARNAYLEQDYKKAVDLYQWVEAQIQDDPVNLPIIQIELGWSYYNIGDFRNCISYLDKSLASESLNVRQQFDCLRLIGFSYGALRDGKNALHFLRKALEIELPENDKKYVNFEVGKIYFLNGAFTESWKYLDTVKKFFSWKEANYYQAILYYQGFLAFYKKEYQHAEKLFTEIVDNAAGNENKASGYFGLAHLANQKRNYNELADICKKILHLDKNFYDGETVLFFLCKAFIGLKRPGELAVFYAKLKGKYPDGRYQNDYPIFDKVLSGGK